MDVWRKIVRRVVEDAEQGDAKAREQLYARLGPAAFYRRRLVWLAEHGKWMSYHRLAAYLERAGIDPGVLQPP
jgi:hypothetical protein